MSDNRVQGTAQATQRATLPGLELPRDAAPAQARFNRAVKEHLEVRQGTRGNPYERGLTLRDVDARLQSLGLTVSVSAAVPRTASGGGVATVGPGGTQTFIPFEALAEKLRSTKLFTDLTRRIDDPARFDDLPERTRALLLEDIAQVRQQADASIRRVDDVIKTATESFAQTVTTVQANISQAAAGVRQVQFASASLNRATAGLVTTITARLDNFSGGAPGTATVESKMTAIADRATGLEAQYTLKVSAGGAMAGFGLAATTNAAGNATSAFIIQADKFAIVSSSYSGGLTTSPDVTKIPFGIDGTGIFMTGNVRIDGDLLVTGTVTTGKLGTGAVTADKLAAGAVTLAKFASSIEPVSIVSSVPGTKSTETVFNTTDGKLYRWNGAAYVATVPSADITGLVTNAQIEALAASKVTGTLTDAQLADISAAKITGQIVETQITDGAISTPKIYAGAVVAASIAAGAITTAKIAAGAVTATEIAAGSITTAKIAAGAVTANEIAAGSITTAKLDALAVTADKLAANSIVAGKIAAGAVSATELSVSQLSAISANLGSVTAGNITGTANIDIAGTAKIKGAFTSGSYNVALAVNESYSAQTGLVAYTTGSTFSAIVGVGMATGASGVFGSSSGGAGVGGNATGSGGVGVSAVGVLGAVALSVTGAMAIDNTSLVTNLNANFVGGKQASELCQIVGGNTGTATVAGTGLNLTTTVSGVTVTCSSNNIVIEAVSDARLKQDIEDEALGLGFIRQLRPRTYRMKADPALLYHGFLYQELAEVLPREGDALVQHRPDRYGGVDYNSLIAPLVLSVQQQDSEVQALRARVAALESQLAA